VAKANRPRRGTADFEKWYSTERPRYEALGQAISAILRGLLTAEVIPFVAATSRAKSTSSLLRKLKEKGYNNPKAEITDFCGVRVIAYLESDVQKIVDLIRKTFVVDAMNSVDKSVSLSVDIVGYRSVHLICTLSDERTKLPEYAVYKDLKFEIQVRTALQHAWAEIEHDRSYKFAGELPPPLQRRLNLAAGLLETADREFDGIVEAIGRYGAEVRQRAERGDLDIELNSSSLSSFLDARFPRLKLSELKRAQRANILIEVMGELDAYGIKTLSQLDDLFVPELTTFFDRKQPGEVSRAGVLRWAMMLRDPQRYFTNSWQGHWNNMSPSDYDFLVAKHGKEKIKRALQGRKIQLVDPDSGEVTPIDWNEPEDDSQEEEEEAI
jgi:putative GTP pyrophosphokinase